MRFGDFLEMHQFVWEIWPSASWNKLFRIALCQWNVLGNFFSIRFCAAKARPTWRFFAEISEFHKIRKIVLAFARKPLGINRSREELSGGQILVENGQQKLWSFKVRVGGGRQVEGYQHGSGFPTPRGALAKSPGSGGWRKTVDVRGEILLTGIGLGGGICMTDQDLAVQFINMFHCNCFRSPFLRERRPSRQPNLRACLAPSIGPTAPSIPPPIFRSGEKPRRSGTRWRRQRNSCNQFI